MSLGPLLNAPHVVQFHAFAAIAAFLLGVVQLAAPKGTLPHRTLGWIWVALLLAISGSSFFIYGDSYRLWRSFSPIHLLSVFTPVMLLLAWRPAGTASEPMASPWCRSSQAPW
jgi:uncharacterized membrane protein